MMWIGQKRIAFIPVWNRKVDIPPPEDWIDQVRERVFYDPDPNGMVDRSLQRYIQTISSGLATITGEVFPVVAAEDEDTVAPGLNSLPPEHGYDYAVIVLPHSAGPHRSGFAWMNNTPINGIASRARVAMFSDVGMTNRNTLGVWAMELLHITTGFLDLYFTDPMIGRYDVMACGCGTHPSAHTKSHFGWLYDGAVLTHPLGHKVSYSLHAISLPQPAPGWRRSAIQVASRKTSGHFMIEARLRTDPYESASEVSRGIPAQGVIVYEVQGKTELYLHTATALQAGQSLTIDDEKLTIRVTEEELGGYRIQVDSAKVNRCVALASEIEALELRLSIETDFFRRKQLISALQTARGAFRRLGCLIHHPGDVVFAEKFFGEGAGKDSTAGDYEDGD